jgi:serpin B
MRTQTIVLGLTLGLLAVRSGPAADDKFVGPPAPDARPAEPAKGQPPPDGALQAARGNNAFAFRLYERLARKDGNVVFSPYSLSAALSMAYAGARGDTAREMARALALAEPPEQHAGFAELIRSLNGHGISRDYQLHVANALWVERGEPLLDDFQAVVREHYGSRPRPLDFRTDPPAARQEINRWVADHTAGKVPELLGPQSVGPRTTLVLSNAVYFSAGWQSKFDAARTAPGEFQTGKDRKVTVPLMSQVGKFNYLDGGTFQAVELPYEGKDVSMLVFLPREANGLAALEKELSAERLAGWPPCFRAVELRVTLPRFRAGVGLSLKKQLGALGVRQAFSPGADFSGITGKNNLSLDEVLHQAVVDVKEGGTEAAAATHAVAVKRGGSELAFAANHPFVFLICDNRTGAILFLGRLVDPAGSGSTATKARQ